MQKMPSRAVLFLLTDSPTKKHQLESEIVSYGKEKDISVIVVIAPKYNGEFGDASWNVYQRISNGRVFVLPSLDFHDLFREARQLEGMNCFKGRHQTTLLLSCPDILTSRFLKAKNNLTYEVLLPDLNVTKEAVCIQSNLRTTSHLFKIFRS